MHEISLAQSILDIVASNLGQPRKLCSLSLRLGVLAGVNAEALRFALAELAADNGFGRPEIIIKEVPAQARCDDCACAYEMGEPFALCPQCGSLSRTLGGGDEMILEEVACSD